MTVAEALAYAVRTLRAAGIEGAERDARALVAHAAAVPADRLALMRTEAFGAHAALDAALAARTRRQPVAQITGRRAFWDFEVTVTRDTLDPRPETETLVAAAIGGPAPERLLDLGTGTGCIAIALLRAWPAARGVAVDISPAALAVAERNATALGVADRLELVESDWFDGVHGCFNLMVSNPPYLSTTEWAAASRDIRDWEPRAALTPGRDGLGAYRRIAADSVAHAAPGGRMLLEMGVGQADAVRALMTEEGWSARIVRDLDGRDRVIDLKRSSEEIKQRGCV